MSVTRPRLLREVEVLARIHTGKAVETLAEIMSDRTQPSAARVSAANALLDRGWGKAPQVVTVEETPEHMNDEELNRVIAERIAAIAANAGAAGGTPQRSEAGGHDAGAEASASSGKLPRVVH